MSEWLPIESAPKDEKFLVENYSGDTVLVELYENPFGDKNTVIDWHTGKWWTVNKYMPLQKSSVTK